MKTAVEMPIVGLRWNRYGKVSATQDAVIEIRIWFNAKVKYLSTRLRAYPKEWDEKNKRVVNRFDAAVINRQLEKLIIDVRQVIYDMYEEGNIDIDAMKEGLVQSNPYDRVKIEIGNDYDGIEKCLTPDEFQLLKTATIPDARLERVRDLFVFHTYSCLAYHDLRAFDSKKIQEVDGGKVYTGHRGKTKIEFTVPLLSPALDILKKYKGKLPMLSNVKYNAYLKEVVAVVGIDKPITTHWARHTGATLLLNAGVPIEKVSKVCGHSTIKMTEKIYAKLLPKTVVAAVNEVEEKLILKHKAYGTE